MRDEGKIADHILIQVLPTANTVRIRMVTLTFAPPAASLAENWGLAARV